MGKSTFVVRMFSLLLFGWRLNSRAIFLPSPAAQFKWTWLIKLVARIEKQAKKSINNSARQFGAICVYSVPLHCFNFPEKISLKNTIFIKRRAATKKNIKFAKFSLMTFSFIFSFLLLPLAAPLFSFFSLLVFAVRSRWSEESFSKGKLLMALAN